MTEVSADLSSWPRIHRADPSLQDLKAWLRRLHLDGPHQEYPEGPEGGFVLSATQGYEALLCGNPLCEHRKPFIRGLIGQGPTADCGRTAPCAN